VLANIYAQQANNYLENFDFNNKANERVDQCTKALDYSLDLITKYLADKKYKNLVEEISLENAFVYNIGKLGRTKNKQTIDKYLKSISTIVKRQEEYDLVK
jgi:hypothetical protein